MRSYCEVVRTSSRLTALLLFDEVELLDVALVSSILTSAGRKWNFRPFKLVPVAARATAIETRSQLSLAPDRRLDECTAPELVIVPGGYGARRVLSDDAVREWLGAAGGEPSELLATGNGVMLLAGAGLLEGAEVACSVDSATELGQLCPTCRAHTDEHWRASGRITTSRSAMGTARAALHLVGKLLGPKHAVELAIDLGLPQEGENPAPGALEILPARQ